MFNKLKKTIDESNLNDSNNYANLNNKKLLSKLSDVVRWCFGILFILFALVNVFHYSSLFLIAAAVLILPINYIISFCEKINIKSKTAIVLSIVLFFVGVMTSPTHENPSVDSGNDLNKTSEVEGGGNGNDSNGEKDEKPQPHEHTEEVLHAKDATCTEKGLTEGVKCSVCSEVLVVQTEIAAKGHSYKEGKCTICDADDTNYKPKVEDGDNKEDSNDSTDKTPTIVENQKYTVTFTSRIIEENSVGSDWTKGVKYENISIRSGDTIENKMNNTLSIIAFAIEQDDSGDDYGSITIEFSKIGIGEKTSQTVIVKVAEDKGRYKGNIAKVEFTITIERIA